MKKLIIVKMTRHRSGLTGFTAQSYAGITKAEYESGTGFRQAAETTAKAHAVRLSLGTVSSELLGVSSGPDRNKWFFFAE